MPTKSLLEYAYDYIRDAKGTVSFKDLWAYVCEQANLSEEEATKKVSRFYTNLMLDGRFVTLGESKWDLRERHTLKEVHHDLGDIYSDVEESDEDEEDAEEEKEYNEVFEEPNHSDSGDDMEPDVSEDEESDDENN